MSATAENLIDFSVTALSTMLGRVQLEATPAVSYTSVSGAEKLRGMVG